MRQLPHVWCLIGLVFGPASVVAAATFGGDADPMIQTAQIPPNAQTGYLPIDNSKTFNLAAPGERVWKSADGEVLAEKIFAVVGPRGVFVDPSPSESAKHKATMSKLSSFAQPKFKTTASVVLNLDEGRVSFSLKQQDPVLEMRGSAFLWKLDPDKIEVQRMGESSALGVQCNGLEACAYVQFLGATTSFDVSQTFGVLGMDETQVDAVKEALAYFVRNTRERK